jgi:hypothetical protein
MVSIISLWLPILLSAVLVFIASSILHMVLPLHKRDYKKVPGEGNVMDALREAKIPRGNYVFPCPDDPKDMKSPEMVEKYNKGPIGFLTMMPTGPPAMGKFLVMWFIYCLVMSVFVAYLAGRTLGPGTEYLAVFRVAGATAFIGYSAAHVSESIWMGKSWSTTVKNIFDGLVYALLTAGAFAGFWPN